MDPIKVDFSGKGRPKEVVIPPEKKVLKIIICIIATIIGAAIAYYFMLPAINLKSMDFYTFIGTLLAIFIGSLTFLSGAMTKPEYTPYVKKASRVPLIIAGILVNPAKAEALSQLEEIYEKALVEVGETNAQIFEVHMMMLEDDDYN